MPSTNFKEYFIHILVGESFNPSKIYTKFYKTNGTQRFFGIDYTYYKNCISSLVPSLIPYPSISQKNISIKNVFNVRYKAELDSFLIVPIFFTYGLVYLEWHKFRELGSVVAVAILCLTLIWLFRHVEIRKTKDNSNEVPT